MNTDIAPLRLLREMLGRSASDLFLTEGKPPAFRVHGQICGTNQPATTRAELEELFALAVGHGSELFSHDRDVGLTLGPEQRFRLSFLRQEGRLGVVARLVPSGALEFAELGLPPVIAELASKKRGLVLVTGATGSGKSTTLAAMVHHINQTQDVHLITIEDPIEFRHADLRARISQREIGADTPDFLTALRQAVRQSPDVILIGELRDLQTVSVAISAALTGHLVLATLHTVDAAQTLQRLLSMFPEYQRPQVALDLSLCLQGLVSQRLVPRADRAGRVVAAEILVNSPAVARLLREQRIHDLLDLMRSLRQPGIQTFNEVLLQLHRAGTIDHATGMAYAANPDEFALLARGMATGADTFRKDAGDDVLDLELDLRKLLERVVELGASDLHLTVGRPPLMRLHGNLRPLSRKSLGEGDVRTLLYGIMSTAQRSQYDLEREIDFAISIETGRRFRVNAYFQKGRMAAALRAIPHKIPSAVTLGLPDSVLELGNRHHGLMLVVGPTGSGKSTTLACLVDRINRNRPCRIITIEDPVEYVHDSLTATVDQREVLADTRSFAAALKYILRQDPDVIMVGEMRDLETISSALTAAETGHLVLATLHSNDAIQAIDRVIDVFPPHQQPQIRAMLASALVGVVSQRLLPRRDGAGRVGIFEIMVGTPAIRTLIRDNKLHQARAIMEAAARDGMVTMDAALKRAVDLGEVGYEEALAHMVNPKTLIPPAPDPIPPSPRPGTGFSRR